MARLKAGLPAICFCLVTGTALAAENRCGWYLMPSPGNLLLQDKDGAWSITSQDEAAGPDARGAAHKAPEFDPGEFVRTGNAGYGYGCACLSVTVDADAQRVVEVAGGSIRPLAVCKDDKSLAAPDM